MPTRVRVALALLIVATRAPLAAQTVAHPLLDSARLFGGEWDATTLVRVDSTATDSTTLRRIDFARWLGPRRLVYAGPRAAGGQRALLGWVDGKTILLAVDDREFAPAGRPIKIRFGQGWRLPSEFVAASGELYVSTATGRGFSVYATDGARWRGVAHRDDTLAVRGRRVEINNVRVFAADPQGQPLATFEGEGLNGIARLTPAGIEMIVADRDTLADGAVIPAGITHLTYGTWQSFHSNDADWSILFRPKHAFLYGRAGGAPRLLAQSTEPMPGDTTRDWQDIRSAVPLGDGRFVVLVRRDQSVLLGKPGAWRRIASGNAWLRERGTVFAIGDANVMDSGIVFSVVQGSQENIGGRIVGRFVDLYYFDGTAVRPAPWDSAMGTTIRDWRRTSPGGGFELAGDVELRSIPGYPARTVVRTPLFRNLRGGRVMPAELLLDPATGRLTRMPAMRVAGRDSVSLSDIIGWNSRDEAVVLLGNEIAALRRRP